MFARNEMCEDLEKMLDQDPEELRTVIRIINDGLSFLSCGGSSMSTTMMFKTMRYLTELLDNKTPDDYDRFAECGCFVESLLWSESNGQWLLSYEKPYVEYEEYFLIRYDYKHYEYVVYMGSLVSDQEEYGHYQRLFDALKSITLYVDHTCLEDMPE